MPIIQSAKKQLRQNKKRRVRNDRFRDKYTQARVAFEKAEKAGDAVEARKVWESEKKDGKTVRHGLQSIIDTLVKKNLLHKNNAARKKSHYAKVLKELETAK